METREAVVIESQGQKVFGILHLPEIREEKTPLVVSLHGFASSKHGTNRCYVTLAEKLAKEGIATLRFDFRGAGDSEGTLSTVSLEDLVEDALSAYRYVDDLEGIDSDRIGVFGASLGGSIAVLSASRCEKIKSIVLWSPVASGELWVRDFMSQNPKFLKTDPKELLAVYKGIPLNAQFRQQFGKMSAAKEMPDVPVLHMHGECDQTVSLLHQQVYKLHCEEKSTPSKFISYPETEHALGSAPVFHEALDESLAWFKEHL